MPYGFDDNEADSIFDAMDAPLPARSSEDMRSMYDPLADAPKQVVRYTPKAPGAGGDAPPTPAPKPPASPRLSEYDALRKAFASAPQVPDFTWASRIAAEGVNLGRPDLKTDYWMAEDNQRAVQSARTAPIAREMALFAAKRADADRAQADRHRTAQITKLEREPAEKQATWQVQVFDAFQSGDPKRIAGAERFLEMMPPALAAQIRAAASRDVAGMNNATRENVTGMQVGLGDRKIESNERMAADRIGLGDRKIESNENIAGKKIEESKRKERLSRLTGLGKATTPLAEGYGAAKKILERFPDLKAGVAPDASPDWIERAARIDPTGFAARILDKNSQEFKLMSTDFRLIQQQIRSGAALTDAEVKLYENQFGDRVFSDPKLMVLALKWYTGLMAEKLRAAQAPYESDVLEDYGATGAPTYKADWIQPFFKALVPDSGARPASTPTQRPAARGEEQVPPKPEGDHVLMQDEDGPVWVPRAEAKAVYDAAKGAVTFKRREDELSVLGE
jgi:hypothetical protein